MKQYKCKKLDKLCWDNVDEITLNGVLRGEELPLKTTAKMCFTDSHFHFRFDLEDDYVCANMNGFNEPLYEEDVVEIFIDDSCDGCDGKSYIEVEINHQNAVLFYYIVNNNADISQYARIKNTIKSSVTKTNYGYIIEGAIPLYEFVNIKGKWRVNLYRIDRSKDNDPSKDKYYAWCPTGRAYFHAPECFGEIILPENL